DTLSVLSLATAFGGSALLRWTNRSAGRNNAREKHMASDAPPRGAACTPVVVVAHPGERRRGCSTVPAQAGHCCCCCCCCCLHSLGGLIGAAVAPNLGAPGPRSYMRLTYYWDEEDYDAGPRTLSGRERESITAEPLSAPPAVEQPLP